MDIRFSPCTAHIDLGCIRRNLQRLPAPPEHIMPVIKSDAYGHGLIPVARTLSGEGVRAFAVGTVDEALALRHEGFTQEIVTLLGATTPAALRAAAAQNITPLIFSQAQLAMACTCVCPEQPLGFALKCETGMGRLGFCPEQLPAVLDILRATPWIQPRLTISHFACADMPEQDAYTRQQASVFFAMGQAVHEVFPHVRLSLCNSPASLVYPEFHADLLRPGEALYGGNPLHGTAWAHLGASLEPAMSVCAPVLHVYDAPAGQSVSYGRTFTTAGPRRMAVLGMGYADGFARLLSNRSFVYLAGRRVPLCGRVCMGMMMADITGLAPEAVVPGMSAWVLGCAESNTAVSATSGPVSLQELADIWGTIPYEVQCLLGRNSRQYTDDGPE